MTHDDINALGINLFGLSSCDFFSCFSLSLLSDVVLNPLIPTSRFSLFVTDA